jgi:DNA-binding winged helix-turn-helix (wHTH) protein/Tol biopolymer transport system component
MEKRAHAGGNAEFSSNVRFGPFELDLRRRELRKEGRKIRLQEQPFQILKILLESPGEVVSREEIRERLWPDETVVEFDHSINAAIRRLRDALRDSADNPRYIKTIARQGYCFVGKAETEAATQAEPIGFVPEAALAENVLSNSHAGKTPPEPRPLNLRMIVPVLVVTILLIVWASASYYTRRPHPQTAPLQPLMRLDVDLGNDASPDPKAGPNAILSPDGTRLVYVSHSKLFTRRLDEAQATELPGTEGAQYPFFSPDAQWLGFFAGGSLKKVSIQQRQVIRLCDGSGENGAAWGEDGNIIVGVNFRLARLPSGGGTPVSVTELEPGEIVHRWPRILPGGKAVLFSAYRSLVGLDGASIDVVSLKDGRRKTVVRGGTSGQYLPSGHLVYINQGTLFAVAFDAGRLEVQGTPTPVLENVAYRADRGSAQIDFSRTGTLVYQSSTVGTGLVTVQWLDESGSTRPLLPVPGNYLSPTLSPDGTRLALSSAGDIWLYEFGRGSMTRLTVSGGYTNPLWTVDGRYLLVRSLSQRARGIWWIRADGMSQPQLLMQSNNLQVPWSFPADGKRLAFNELSAANIDDIWTVPVETASSGLRAGKPELFLQTPFHQRAPTFSPDGRWIAYQSNESGRYQIYVQAFPNGRGKRQISGEAGTHPAWSPKRHELFFISSRGLMSVSYQAHGESFVVEKPRVWFEKKIANFGPTQSYAPAPDGKSIVALIPAEPPEERHDRVIFLLNFFDELRRRVPSGTN